jgi:archaellin
LFAIFFFFLFFPIFLFFKIRNFNYYSCINWAKGLNDTYIDNTSKDYPCLINIPKGHSCYLDEIGKYFDFSLKFRPTCLDNELLESQRKYFLKSIQNYNIKYYNISKKNYFGYPITNNDKFNIKEFGTVLSKDKKNLEEELHKNIILMDLYIKNKTKYYPNETKPEVYVKFNKGRGKIKIIVQKNKTLIKEREKKLGYYNNKLMFKNVIVLFFDTKSRAHFFRKFPKTISFLNKFSRYDTNLKKKINNFSIF